MGATLGPGPWCGTPGGYTNHRCRCERCREAWAIAHKAYMHRNPEQQRKHREAQARRRKEARG